MRITRLALIATTALLAACGTDETTAPNTSGTVDTRLAAVAAPPTSSVADANVTMMVAITSSLPEAVSGGVCAQIIEARLASGTAWTNVTSTSAACSMLAAQLLPGGTLNISAIGDQAKIRTVAGSSSSVVLRARHTLAGASTSYTLQSNEITYQLP